MTSDIEDALSFSGYGTLVFKDLLQLREKIPLEAMLVVKDILRWLQQVSEHLVKCPWCVG
jgi:hypothetical protein